MKNILDEAAEILKGDRRDAYGGVRQSFGNLARMWSLILGHDVTPAKVCMCMIGLKITRELNCHKRDNLVDLAGYAKLLSVLEGDEEPQSKGYEEPRSKCYEEPQPKGDEAPQPKKTPSIVPSLDGRNT